MSSYGVTPAGFILKTEDDITSSIFARLQGKLGLSNALDGAPFLHPLVTDISKEIASVWQAGNGVYNSFTRGSSEGVALENVGQFIGLEKLEETHSTCPVELTGTAGATISGTIIIAHNETGEKFTCEGTTFDGAGKSTETMTAQNPGPIQAPAGTLTVVESSYSDLDSAINHEDAELGRNVEAEYAFRERIAGSGQGVGSAACNAIKARLVDDIDGVESAECYENEDDDVDEEGVPGHSIHPVVYSPSALSTETKQEIANLIHAHKAGGIKSHGSIEMEVEASGADKVIRFDEAEKKPVYYVALVVGNEFPSGVDIGQPQNLTFTVSADVPAGDPVEHTITLNGQDFTYEAPGGTSKENVATALYNLLVDGVIRKFMNPIPSALEEEGYPFVVTYPSVVAEVITCEGIIRGWNMTYSCTSNIEAVETQAATGLGLDMREAIVDGVTARQKIGQDFGSSPFACLYENWSWVGDALYLQNMDGNPSDAYAPVVGSSEPPTPVAISQDEVANIDTTRVIVWLGNSITEMY